MPENAKECPLPVAGADPEDHTKALDEIEALQQTEQTVPHSNPDVAKPLDLTGDVSGNNAIHSDYTDRRNGPKDVARCGLDQDLHNPQVGEQYNTSIVPSPEQSLQSIPEERVDEIVARPVPKECVPAASDVSGVSPGIRGWTTLNTPDIALQNPSINGQTPTNITSLDTNMLSAPSADSSPSPLTNSVCTSRSTSPLLSSSRRENNAPVVPRTAVNDSPLFNQGYPVPSNPQLSSPAVGHINSGTPQLSAGNNRSPYQSPSQQYQPSHNPFSTGPRSKWDTEKGFSGRLRRQSRKRGYRRRPDLTKKTINVVRPVFHTNTYGSQRAAYWIVCILSILATTTTALSVWKCAPTATAVYTDSNFWSTCSQMLTGLGGLYCLVIPWLNHADLGVSAPKLFKGLLMLAFVTAVIAVIIYHFQTQASLIIALISGLTGLMATLMLIKDAGNTITKQGNQIHMQSDRILEQTDFIYEQEEVISDYAWNVEQLEGEVRQLRAMVDR